MVAFNLMEGPMSRTVARLVFSVVVSAFLVVVNAPVARAQAAAPGAARTYVWIGELVSFDSAAKAMTVKASVNEAVTRYLDRFKPGQRVMLVWTADNTKPETGPVRYIESYDTMKNSNVDQGFIIPVEFVSGDAVGRTVTFKTTTSDAIAQALSGIPPGRTLRATTPIGQPSETARLSSIEVSAAPATAIQAR
jgi:hypothetical protein